MKSKSAIFVLLIVLSIIIGVAGGFFISKMICEQRISKLESELQYYKSNFAKVDENTTKIENPVLKVEEDDNIAPFVPDGTKGNQNLALRLFDETGFAVSRIDSSKDWVYDAPYEKNVVAESYTPDIGEKKTTTYAKDIVVPYININSVDANVANSEIKSIFDKIVSIYNKQTHHIKCGYEKYVNDTCISVYAANRMEVTDIGELDAYTFNIDLKTGKKMSYSDVYKSIGYNDNNIETKVEDAIASYMRNTMSDTYNKSYDEEAQRLVEEAINNYKQSVKDNTIKYYLAENGSLRIVVKMRFMDGFGGGHYEVITID